MTISKLPSGSYRIEEMIDGKRIRLTVKQKPTQKEARAMLDAMKKNPCSTITSTFKECATEYNESKSNILSPRTLLEYGRYINRLPAWFIETKMCNVTKSVLQKCVNELCEKLKPKTVRCLNGYISSVLSAYDISIKVTLPTIYKNEVYIPTMEDLNIILKEAENTQYDIPIRLGMYGLRRGEICALELSDLSEDNYITICKSYIQGKDGWIVKQNPKTKFSVRKVPIDDYLADLIRKQGYVFNGFPGTISNYLRRTQDKYEMPHFSLHKLRHLFASMMLEKGFTIKDAQELGGWSSNSGVLYDVYQHSLKDAERKKQIILSLYD